MKVIANRQLHGEYGTVVPDQEVDLRDSLANELLKSGMVRHALPPRVEYETKVIVPEAPEVGPRRPFRHVSLPDEKSENVAAKSDSVLPAADVRTSGAAGAGGRGGRSGSGSGR